MPPWFHVFQASRVASIGAMRMLSVAIAWQVYELTKRPLSLGLVGLAQFLPMLGISLIVGHAIDRFDRRRILCASYLVLFACALTLVWVRSPMGIYAVLVLIGAGRASAEPAAEAILPSLLPVELVARGIASMSSLRAMLNILGPALGGVAYKYAGATFVFSLCAGCFAVAIGLTLLVRIVKRAPSVRGFTMRAVLSGLVYVWRTKVILSVLSLDMLAVLLGGSVALLPVFARDVLHAGPIELGLLRSAPAIGAAVGGAFLAWRPLGGRAGVKLLVSVVVFGVATVVFGLSRSFLLSVGALVVLGAADMVSMVVRFTLVQLATPDEMRGRVSAVNYVFIGASNELGELESGLTAEWLGAVPAVIIGGVGSCAVVALWALLFPELRRIDRLDASAAQVDSAAN